jgi:hypothetical protein
LQKIHGAEEPCNFTGMMHDFNHLEFHSWLMDGYSPNMVIIGSEWFWPKKRFHYENSQLCTAYRCEIPSWYIIIQVWTRVS